MSNAQSQLHHVKYGVKRATRQFSATFNYLDEICLTYWCLNTQGAMVAVYQRLLRPRSRSVFRARPRGKRHERLTTQHGGLWYHLWVRRRRGWARSEWGTLAQILSGARGYARGRAHYSVSRAVFVVAVCPTVALFCLACLAEASLWANANHNNWRLTLSQCCDMGLNGNE